MALGQGCWVGGAVTPGLEPRPPPVASGLWLRPSILGGAGEVPEFRASQRTAPEAWKPGETLHFKAVHSAWCLCDRQTWHRAAGGGLGVRMERQLPRGTESFSDHPRALPAAPSGLRQNCTSGPGLEIAVCRVKKERPFSSCVALGR